MAIRPSKLDLSIDPLLQLTLQDYNSRCKMSPLPPTKENVCAVVVSYHPDDAFSSRLARLASQVTQVIVVDNHSRPAALTMIRAICIQAGYELLENEENLGVAAALNRGIANARAQGFAWVLTMDQDSVAYPNLVSGLCNAFDRAEAKGKVGMIGTLFHQPVADATGETPPVPVYEKAEFIITSGALLSLTTYEVAGPFRDDFFIDCVDDEYCLRLRRLGWTILCGNEIGMIHSIGEPVIQRFFWRCVVGYHHSPLRQYYKVRNRRVLAREYGQVEPAYIARLSEYTRAELKALVLFESNKLRWAYAVWLGYWHAWRGKMGKVHSRLLSSG